MDLGRRVRRSGDDLRNPPGLTTRLALAGRPCSPAGRPAPLVVWPLNRRPGREAQGAHRPIFQWALQEFLTR
jgi:hypothetical protein